MTIKPVVWLLPLLVLAACGGSGQFEASSGSGTSQVEQALVAYFNGAEYQADVVGAVAIAETQLIVAGDVEFVGRLQRDDRGPFHSRVSCVNAVGNRYDCKHVITNNTRTYRETTELAATFDPATKHVVVTMERTSDGSAFPG